MGFSLDNWVQVLCDLQLFLHFVKRVRDLSGARVEYRDSWAPYSRFGILNQFNLEITSTSRIRLYKTRGGGIDGSAFLLLSPYSFMKLFEAVMEGLIKSPSLTYHQMEAGNIN